MSFWTALHISYTVRAATDTAVSASISTPVLPLTLTRASMSSRPLAACGVNATSIEETGSGWQSGMSSGVFLAASMPATRATAKTSPLGSRPSVISRSVSGDIRTLPVAVATRAVTGLSPTSTICARPRSST